MGDIIYKAMVSGLDDKYAAYYTKDEYKDINNTGSGSNGVASKSLLYTMSVKVYYGSNADTSKEEPMIQMTTTKIG
jgi:C-terminal processing protease CtpA/Prc